MKNARIASVDSATPGTPSKRAWAVRSNDTRSSGNCFSSSRRSTPSAWRRSANGSFSPVGARPMPQMPTIVSSLSASATAVDTGVVGSASPEARLVVLGAGERDVVASPSWRA